MLITFLFEIGSALYILWRYKLSTASRLVVMILGCLGVFQAAEYIICGGGSMEWAQAGFVAITLLPPLGFHLASVLAKKNHYKPVYLAYVTSIIFIVTFGFLSHSIQNQTCTGNYVMFDFMPGLVYPYTLYYYGWLFIGTYFSYRWSKTVKVVSNKKALQALMAGYLLFILPTTTANIIDPTTLRAIPSIMCGFGVLLAITLVYWVIPAVAKVRRSSFFFRYNREK